MSASVARWRSFCDQASVSQRSEIATRRTIRVSKCR